MRLIIRKIRYIYRNIDVDLVLLRIYLFLIKYFLNTFFLQVSYMELLDIESDFKIKKILGGGLYEICVFLPL